ncbi:MAG: adaptor protein MecA, partial [Oscillospiraceae bacterium]|nr:adaptor protein MecA [Oscillospiraceae bacterium]
TPPLSFGESSPLQADCSVAEPLTPPLSFGESSTVSSKSDNESSKFKLKSKNQHSGIAGRKSVRITPLPPDCVKQPRFLLENELLCRFDSYDALSGACRSLAWESDSATISDISDTLDSSNFKLKSTLYADCGEYRLLLSCNQDSPEHIINRMERIATEYGKLLPIRSELLYTDEHFKRLIEKNAIHKIAELY